MICCSEECISTPPIPCGWAAPSPSNATCFSARSKPLALFKAIVVRLAVQRSNKYQLKSKNCSAPGRATRAMPTERGTSACGTLRTS